MPITTQPNVDSPLAKRRQQRRFQSPANVPPRKPLATKKLWILLISAFYVCMVILAWQTKLFTIKHIDCQVTDGSECSQNIRDQLSYYLEGKFILGSLQPRLDQAFSHHSTYQFQAFQRQLPNRIVVEAHIVEHAYHLEQSGQKWTVDKNGHVQRYSEQVLPVVQVSQFSVQESTQIDTIVHQQLSQLTEILKTAELPATTIHWVSNSEIRLQLETGKTVIVKLENLPAQLELFRRLKDYPFENKDWQELDLRFDKPVVR